MDAGGSRKFAFVRFVSVGHATQFVKKHYPHFYMGRHRVRIDYSHNDSTKDDKSEWRCTRVGFFSNLTIVFIIFILIFIYCISAVNITTSPGETASTARNRLVLTDTG